MHAQYRDISLIPTTIHNLTGYNPIHTIYQLNSNHNPHSQTLQITKTAHVCTKVILWFEPSVVQCTPTTLAWVQIQYTMVQLDNCRGHTHSLQSWRPSSPAPWQCYHPGCWLDGTTSAGICHSSGRCVYPWGQLPPVPVTSQYIQPHEDYDCMKKKEDTALRFIVNRPLSSPRLKERPQVGPIIYMYIMW